MINFKNKIHLQINFENEIRFQIDFDQKRKISFREKTILINKCIIILIFHFQKC